VTKPKKAHAVKSPRRRPAARPPKPNTVDKLIETLESGPPIVGPTPPKPSLGLPGLQCSFCGKSQAEVKKLIAGPTVYICDECIALCRDICIEDDVALPPVDKTITEEKKAVERKAAADKAQAEKVAKATEILSLITEGKSFTAQTRLRELSILVGDDSFTKAEVQNLLALCAAANEAHLSVADYVVRLKNQLALWERATPKAAWGDLGGSAALAMLGALGIGASAYMMAGKRGAK